jgi:acetylornithine deacetylase/succinyl-diaminopimelate desuccinylase-like protein
MPEPNFDQLADEAVTHLRDLIRFDTTNPPGNELLAAEHLAGVLEREGLSPVVLESAPGRGNVICRLSGSGQARPLLLMSHLDVVPAEPESWTHPPFAADVADGFVWGRGAVDTKNLTAIELVVVLALRRADVRLKRDVVFAATADEEAGGRYGAGWLAREHHDLIDAEFAINEGGGLGIEMGNRRFYLCQTGEKAGCRVALRARGQPGHGSVPHNDQAAVHLGRALVRLDKARLPMHVTATARAMIEGLAAGLGGVRGLAVRGLLVPSLGPGLLQMLPLPLEMRRYLYAMLHNTATPTILDAGTRINVIPGTATARLDGRILPGQTPDSFLGELRAVVGDGVELEVLSHGEPLQVPFDSPLTRTIAEVMAEMDPGSRVIPLLAVGGTDAKRLAPAGVQVYGFCPMREEPGDNIARLAHAYDERISIQNLRFGVEALYRIVHRFCVLS